ncbi:hypothetical protein SCORR_v1c05350 [Spiroplasma corruscae]|uniref:Uncharacterized protein n=1 Tax=Spiroplasma corruscae TaxID=216934 RepID=A0A222EP86_9MOLU|nr:hypothetical protein [Spiroplasma corruscae]ASP28307.1 hypothetical protein SCORR_v1c05350 [Spiroplasma corruscae]
MSIFSAAGWLLGIPPKEQREARKEWERKQWRYTSKKIDEINAKQDKLNKDYENFAIYGSVLTKSFPVEFFNEENNDLVDKVIDKFINDYSNAYDNLKDIGEKIDLGIKYTQIWKKKKSLYDIENILKEIEKEEKEQLNYINVSNSNKDIDKEIEVLKLQKEILELKAQLAEKDKER